jgi:hypothetical protein
MDKNTRYMSLRTYIYIYIYIYILQREIPLRDMLSLGAWMLGLWEILSPSQPSLSPICETNAGWDDRPNNPGIETSLYTSSPPFRVGARGIRTGSFIPGHADMGSEMLDVVVVVSPGRGKWQLSKARPSWLDREVPQGGKSRSIGRCDTGPRTHYRLFNTKRSLNTIGFADS